MSIVLSKTTKGKDKIILEGFAYEIEKSVNNSFYWRCEEKREKKCAGRLITVANNGVHTVKKNNGNHNHASSGVRANVLKAIENLRDRAHSSEERPSQILRGIKRSLDDDEITQLPSNEALTKRIKRLRQSSYGIENTQGIDFELSDDLKFINGEQFCIGDHNRNNERVLVFSSTESLKLLATAQLILLDGTFKIAPLGFRQLYTIHALFGEAGMHAYRI